jgi:hypothetical protein
VARELINLFKGELQCVNMTQDELKQRPEDPKDITPVYYVIETISNADEKVTICVSTNKREHNFILK